MDGKIVKYSMENPSISTWFVWKLSVGPSSVHQEADYFLKMNAVHSPTHQKPCLPWKICLIWSCTGYMKISYLSSCITQGSRDCQRWSNITVYSRIIAVHKLLNFLWKFGCLFANLSRYPYGTINFLNLFKDSMI